MNRWVNTSTKAFDDVMQLLDRALQSERGVRVPCPNRSSAVQLRSRANYYRKMTRIESKEIYPFDDKRHGVSPYDGLILRLGPKDSPEEAVLYVEPRLASSFTIEDIP